MRTSTSRALRAAATVAGVVALGATFAGNAAAYATTGDGLQSKSVHASSLDKSIRADSDDSDDEASDAVKEEFCDDSHKDKDANGNGFQNPVQCKHNDFLHNFGTGDELSLDDFNHSFGTSGPSGLRSAKPVDDINPRGGLGNVDRSKPHDKGSSEDPGVKRDEFPSGEETPNASSLEDLLGEGDGLSGRKVEVPIG